MDGASTSDYRNQWLPIDGLGWALTGIRFWSLDLDRPFVTVVASTKLPAEQKTLASAVERLRQAYEVFRPRHVRFFLPAHHPFEPSGDGQFWEKRFLAASIEELVEQPRPVSYERVELRRATGTSNYSRYRQAFEELLTSSPEHREYIRLEPEQDLAELASTGNLFEILVEGTWAGTAAVDEECEEGIRGYRVVEFLLAGDFRGQRLGAAAQRHLAEKLERRQDRNILFGTIDIRNRAAIQSASRVGRIDLGGYLWTTTANPTGIGAD